MLSMYDLVSEGDCNDHCNARMSKEEDGEYYLVNDVDTILKSTQLLKAEIEALVCEAFDSQGEDVPVCTIAFYTKLRNISLAFNNLPLGDFEMKKLLIVSICLIALFSSCGKFDRMKAGHTGYSEVVVDGVVYIKFTSGVTVKYNTDGSIATKK